MSIFSTFSPWLQYLSATIHAPQWRDYYDMGLGIAARSRRLGQYWSTHLERSKAFQRQVLEHSKFSGDMALLGAGRCLDLEISTLGQACEKLYWYDLDQTALVSAKPLLESYSAEFKLLDLTGSIANWTEQLNKVSSQKVSDLTNLLDTLRPTLFNQIGVPKHAGILSLNILGQIPLYWRDRVYKAAKRIAKLTPDWKGDLAEPIYSSLKNSMRNLQLQHLELLSKHAKGLVILITDGELIYTQNNSKIHTESALLVSPAELFSSDWKLTHSDQWQWDIAPQGRENSEYGCQHLIKAWAWQR